MAVYFTHTCGHPGCGERVTSAAKRSEGGSYWDHVGARYGGKAYDHDVTDVQTTRTEEAAA